MFLEYHSSAPAPPSWQPPRSASDGGRDVVTPDLYWKIVIGRSSFIYKSVGAKESGVIDSMCMVNVSNSAQVLQLIYRKK